MDSDAIVKEAVEGAAQDIVVLIGIFDQLQQLARQELLSGAVMTLATKWASHKKNRDGTQQSTEQWFQSLNGSLPPWSRAAHLMARVGQGAAPTTIGTSKDLQDIQDLVCLYEMGDRANLLSKAADLLVSQRMALSLSDLDEHWDVGDWQKELAEETYPRDCDAAGYITMMTDASGERYTEFFQEGILGTVQCAAEDEGWLGEWVLNVCQWWRSTISPAYAPPTPAEYFGINVSKADHQTEDDDGNCLFDEESWQAEVDKQCAWEFAGLVAQWRARFFDALLAGRQTPNKPQAQSKESVGELSDLSDGDIERLVDNVMNEAGLRHRADHFGTDFYGPASFVAPMLWNS